MLSHDQVQAHSCPLLTATISPHSLDEQQQPAKTSGSVRRGYTSLSQLLIGNNGPVFPQLANSPSLDQAQSTALWPLRYQVKTHTTTQS